MAAINLIRVNATNATNTDATNFNSSTHTPTNGRIAVAIGISRRGAGEPNTPTCSGNNQTWNQIGSSVYAAPVKISAFWAHVASATNTATNIDYGGQTQDAHCMIVGEFTALNTTTPFVQTASGTVAAGTSITVGTLSAFANGRNGTLVVFGSDVNDSTVRAELGFQSPSSGTSAIWAAVRTSDGLCLNFAFRPDNDTACTITMASGNGVGLIAEMGQDGSDAGSGGNANILRGSVVG